MVHICVYNVRSSTGGKIFIYNIIYIILYFFIFWFLPYLGLYETGEKLSLCKSLGNKITAFNAVATKRGRGIKRKSV